MYELINESKQPIQYYNISGTIGSDDFDKYNVVKNSLSINLLCSGTNEFRLGGCYIGQMNISFVDMDIPRNEWIGKQIEFNIGIGTHTIPMGVWTIDKATHSRGIVVITAYNNMIKFDRAVGTDAGTNGFPYDLISLACQMCGMTLGMTRAEVEALPNGNKPLVLNEMGDIETWRDYLYWIAVSLCSFADIDRNGDLVLKTFHNTVDDTIPYDARYSSSSYSDEIITYTGAYIYVDEEKTAEYYHAQTDNGYTLTIGNNPFFQVSKIMREEYMANIIDGLSGIAYNSCSVKIPFGFHYDLGDVLQFPNGQGSSTNLFCIMGMQLKYNGECILTGIAGQKNAKSKTDKNLQGLLTTVSRNAFTSYELRNTSDIVIGEDEQERLLTARIASNTQTKAQIHIEVNLESEAEEDYTQGIVSYLINSEEVELHPTETWIDGNHVLHLMYILPLDANDTNIFDVYLRAIGGEITINRGGVWLYASGAGLVGDDKWDGSIKIQEDAIGWNIPTIEFTSATDSVETNTQVPVGDSLSSIASVWVIPTMSFDGASDNMYIEMHTDVFRRITEDGDIRTTEDNDVRYTEGD